MTTRFMSLFVIFALLAVIPVWAQEDGAVTLKYNPTVDSTIELQVYASLQDMQMSGTPLPFAVQSAGLLTTKVTENGTLEFEDGGTLEAVVEQMTISEVQATVQGDTYTPADLPPVEITFEPNGNLIDMYTVEDEANPAPVQEQGGIDLVASRIMPALTTLGTFPRLPDEPVCVGDEWIVEETREMPIAGPVVITTTNKLVEITDDLAIIETSFETDLPAFEIPSPMIPDTMMQVTGGKVTADGLRRTYDMKRSMVTAAEGAVKIEITADVGFGMPVPISLNAIFNITELIPEPVEEAPAAEAVG